MEYQIRQLSYGHGGNIQVLDIINGRKARKRADRE